jgi:hypothetical protein
MALFQMQNGQVLEEPDNYDPDTGENLAVKNIMNLAAQKGVQMTPVVSFDHPDPKHPKIIATQDEIPQLLKLGLKPTAQVEAENKAKVAQSKLASGDTDFSAGAFNDPDHKATPGYQSGLNDTVDSKVGNALSFHSSPQVAGVLGAVKGFLQGKNDSLSDMYDNDKNAQQAVLNAQQAQHPLASDLSDMVGTSLSALPGGGLSLGRQLAINGALSGVSSANEAVNQDKSLGQVAKEGAYGVAGGVGGTLLGTGATNVLSDVGNIVKKVAPAFIPEGAPKLAKAGFNNLEDYTNTPLREMSENNLADTQKNMSSTFEDIRKGLGTQKEDELENLAKSMPPIDKGKVQNLFDIYDNMHSYNNAKSGINTIANDFNTYNGSPQDRYSAIKMMQEALGEPVPEYDPRKFNEWVFKNYLNNTASKIDNNLNSLNLEKNNVLNNMREGGIKEKNPDLVDHLDLLDNMQNAKTDLLKRLEMDKDPRVQKAAQQGYDVINGNLESLRKNPNNVTVIDNIKKNLADNVWPSENGTPIPDFGVKDILKKSSEKARQVLEDLGQPINTLPGYKSSNLGNINIGYKDIKDAQNPQEIFDKHILSGNDLLDLGKGETMSPNTRTKFKNLINLNEDIKNNPSVSQKIKSDLQNLVDKVQEVARKSYLSRSISESKGIGGAVNRLASMGGAKAGEMTQELKPAYNKISDFLSPHLSPGIQKLMEVSPSFRAKMAAAGMALGNQYPNQSGPQQ